jgi:hypothetical protein
MKKAILPVFACAVMLVACGGEKKVKVYASGKVKIEGNNITLEPGTSHEDKDMSVSGTEITIDNGSGKTTVAVPEDGLYVLNLKTDTLVGAYQNVGEGAGVSKISQEQLQTKIDSLDQLTRGMNVTAANRNFCIAPGKIQKISGNTASQVVGPFLKLPSSFEGGKELEVYKFSTNKEIAELIEKLKKLQ